MLLNKTRKSSETQLCFLVASGRSRHKNKIQRNLVISVKERDLSRVHGSRTGNIPSSNSWRKSGVGWRPGQCIKE